MENPIGFGYGVSRASPFGAVQVRSDGAKTV